MAIDEGIAVQELKYSALRKRLLDDGQVLQSGTIAKRTFLSGDDPEHKGWQLLSGDERFSSFQDGHRGWEVAGGAVKVSSRRDPFRGLPGRGVLVCTGSECTNLVTKEDFVDVELKLEFMVPRGSNSGVKMNGLYEIQIKDSAKAKVLTGSECGGIYPRGEELPTYHVIDDGYPPRVNAAKPPGEWQNLEITFRSPRFDSQGNRVAQAEFVKVVLNGEVIHENVLLDYPTGAAWRLREEVAEGPILLQGDHGSVAFRNILVRPWEPAE